jgi:diguanylate cyclase (GGDEF)-like protein
MAGRPLDPIVEARVALLQGHALLDGVDPIHIEALAARGGTIHVDAGTTLLRTGVANDTLYFILQGRFGVYLGDGSKEAIAFVGPGQTVGEMSIILRRRSTAYVRAIEPSTVMAIEQGAFWHFVELSHPFATNLLYQLARRVGETNDVCELSERAREKAAAAATSDALTGVRNRRWLEEMLPRFAARHARDGTTLSALMVDIDHFKRINDTYGHDVGDVVIRAVAQTLVGALRPSDVVARFGGEEFLVLLPNTPQTGGVSAAERVRARVEAMVLGAVRAGPMPRVTVSVGVASLARGEDAAGVVKRADQALYAAKHGGRNRVELSADVG